MEKKIKKIIRISLIFCLISTLGIFIFKTDFGKTEVKDVYFDSQSGHYLSASIFKPQNASPENKLPTILVEHGGNNNKEEMELYSIELSRRGYIVVAVDMYGMGSSEALIDSEWLINGRGLYDALNYTKTLPYVDMNNIGMLGYSRGGKAVSESIILDNEQAHLIKNVFLLHSDPVYKDEKGFIDIYQNRNVTLLADKYDEYFFSEKADDTGVYSNDANKYAKNLSSPVDFINNKSAQSFLYFGQDPTNQKKRNDHTIYTGKIGNKQATRSIIVSNQRHMSPWYSSLPVKHVTEFFERTMPTNNTIKTASLRYPIRNIFAIIGVFSLLTFITSLAIYLKTKDKDIKLPELNKINRSGKISFLIIQLATITGSILCLYLLNKEGLSAYNDFIFQSANPLYAGLIGLLCGSMNLIFSLLWYKFYGKNNDFRLSTSSIITSKKIILKNLKLTLIVLSSMYLIVTLVKYFFNTNFKIIYWGFMTITKDRLPGTIILLPMFLVFYISLSISANIFNFNTLLGKNKLLNSLFIAFCSSLPTLFVILYVYSRFMLTGWNPMFGGLASAATAVLPIPVIVFMAVLISRYIYIYTGDVYLGGFITGTLAALISWSICEIRIPDSSKIDFTAKPALWLILILGFLSVAICIYFFKKYISAERTSLKSNIK